MTASPEDLRRVRGRFATGVTVVTAGEDGKASGLTVSAFAVLSLTPPLALVCLDRASRTLAMVASAGRFGVNVLGEGQQDLAERFATKDEEKIILWWSEWPDANIGAPTGDLNGFDVIDVDLRGQGLDGRAESTTTNNEESWKLVGPGDNTQKARVFLRDETGRLLQEGFTDAESKTTVNRQAGVDHRIDRPAQQSVFMWTTEELQDELLNAGFVLAKQTSIAGLNANVYEKTILASGCPMLPSATHVVQDAYISVDPSGLDLGEQAVCSNDDGESTLLSARILRTIEVLEASSVPEGVFNWREAETTAP